MSDKCHQGNSKVPAQWAYYTNSLRRFLDGGGGPDGGVLESSHLCVGP